MSEMAGKTVRSALQLSKAAMRTEVTAALTKAMTTTECKIQTGKVGRPSSAGAFESRHSSDQAHRSAGRVALCAGG
jgi:hypothetical protein